MFEELQVPDELTTLKARADLMGITYHPSIGVDKLRDKVTAAMSTETAEPETKKIEQSEEDKEKQRLSDLRDSAMALIRIRVACMNPNKKEWEGEIFSVGNNLIGTVKKYVPFNNEEGWHVPHIIYEQLIESQCQIFITKKDDMGRVTVHGKLIKQYAVEVLPPLTITELEELARRQAMAKSID